MTPYQLRQNGRHRNERAVVFAFAEHYGAIDEGKQCVVFAYADVFAGVVLGAALADEDVACFADFTTKNLHSQSFAMRFATVL